MTVSRRGSGITIIAAPEWLPALSGREVARVAVWAAGRSVFVRAVAPIAESTWIELADRPAGIACALLRPSPGGKARRTPVARFEAMTPEERRRVALFAARIRWLNAPLGSRDGGGHAPSRRELGLRRAMERLGSLGRGSAADALSWSDDEDDLDVRDVRTCVDIVRRRWDRVFARADAVDDRRPGWLDAVLSAVSGDVARLQRAAARTLEGCDPGPLANLEGAVYRDLGFHDAALVAYRMGVEAVVGPLQADVCLAIAKLHRARGEAREAVQWARRSISSPAPSDDQLERASEELIRSGAFDDAHAVLSERCAREPFHRELALSLVELLTWAGRIRDARPLLERATEGGDDPRSMRAKGVLLMMEGRAAEATAELERADRAAPGNAEVAARLAELYLSAGRIEEARERHRDSRRRAQGPSHIVMAAATHEAEQLPPDLEIFALAAHLGESPERWRTAAHDERRRLGLELVAKLGGRRGTHATWRRGGERGGLGLELVRSPPSSAVLSCRNEAATLLRLVGTIPLSEMEQRFEALAERFADSPHPHCYWGELELWLGRYDHAIEQFEAALARGYARWAYIGVAAAHLLRGEDALAEEVLAECDRQFAPLAGATKHVYLGEACRRRGDFAAALEHLDTAVRAKPLRAAAWMNIALTRLALGQGDAALRIGEMLAARVPRLLWDARRAAAGAAAWPNPERELGVVFERALEMMRGNRSSHTITYFDAEGALRVIPTESPWPERLAGYLPFVAMDLRRRVITGLETA